MRWPLVQMAEWQWWRADRVLDGQVMKCSATERLVSRLTSCLTGLISRSLQILPLDVGPCDVRRVLGHRGGEVALTNTPAFWVHIWLVTKSSTAAATSALQLRLWTWGIKACKEVWLSVHVNECKWSTTCECTCRSAWMWKNGGEGREGGLRVQRPYSHHDWLWVVSNEGAAEAWCPSFRFGVCTGTSLL